MIASSFEVRSAPLKPGAGVSSPALSTALHPFALVTRDPQIGDLRPVAGSAASRYHNHDAAPERRREGTGMAHIVVQIIQMLVAIGLAAAVTAIFAVAVISVVHGLHSAGRQR